MKKNIKLKKKLTWFRPKLRSRHPSHRPLRKLLELNKVRCLIRLGSTTPTKRVFPKSVEKGRPIIEINSIEAVKNSSSKLNMKRKFVEAGVRTCDWFIKYDSVGGKGWLQNNVPLVEGDKSISELPYPIVAKHHFGSRGKGNYKLDTQEDLEKWLKNHNADNYIFEKYFSGVREYRIHVTKNGCFYTCRKMLKKDVPEEDRWHRHDSNCVWMLEENPLFDKPVNWNIIVEDCVKALKSVGLDIGGFDVKVQSTNDKDGNKIESPEFKLIEVNSACSLGDITLEKYVIELNKLIKEYGNKFQQ